jgi:hypothetical protein
MNPLIKALGLSLLNAIAYLILRWHDVYASLFPGKEMNAIKVSGSSFLVIWGLGLFMVVLIAVIAGRLSVPRNLLSKNIFSIKR